MAVTEDFKADVLEVLDEYTQALENKSGANAVPFMAASEVDETVTMPAVKYNMNPLKNAAALPQEYKQIGVADFFDRIDKMAGTVEQATTNLETLKQQTEQAAQNANSAADDANDARTQIEANESERQANEEVRKQQESAREQTFTTNETARQKTFDTNEADRKKTFDTNEAARQKTFDTNEADRKKTFDTNEAARQQTFEDAENERMETMLLTHCFVDTDTMELMFVTPENDTTGYEVVDGDLMITVQYEA